MTSTPQPRAIPARIAPLLLCAGLLATACSSEASFTAEDSPPETVEPESPAEATPTAEASPDPVEPENPDEAVFTIDKRIEFAAGATSGTESAAVLLCERDRYTVGAAAGQTMTVSITSLEDNAVFDLIGSDRQLIDSEVTTSTLTLPSGGDYVVVVGGTRGNATYELTVSIT